MVRVAVLGAGFMGGTHAKAYAAMPEVEVAAVYAPTPDRGNALAREVDSRWADALPAMLADASIEAVDIWLPTPKHRKVAEAALATGKHVLREKPIALSREDAQALVRAFDTTDRVFMIAHLLRFWPEYVEIARR